MELSLGEVVVINQVHLLYLLVLILLVSIIVLTPSTEILHLPLPGLAEMIQTFVTCVVLKLLWSNVVTIQHPLVNLNKLDVRWLRLENVIVLL